MRIDNSELSNVLLPSLETIRGESLFLLEYALYVRSHVSHLHLTELQMPKLRLIMNGSIGFINNPELCDLWKIKWNYPINCAKKCRGKCFGTQQNECCHEVSLSLYLIS